MSAETDRLELEKRFPDRKAQPCTACKEGRMHHHSWLDKIEAITGAMPLREGTPAPVQE